MSIQKEKQKQARELLKKRNVVTVGVGKKVKGGVETDETAIIVGVIKKVPTGVLSAQDLVPKTFGKYKTDVQEVGEIRLLENTQRMRPARPGCSIGHKDITAGTHGATVRDRKTNVKAILSNNHVLANVNRGHAGDAILQPGAYDGGTVPNDVIGHLLRFVPIGMAGNTGCSLSRLFRRKTIINEVDCALADPVRQGDVATSVIDIGRIATGPVIPTVGMPVIKSGRTTGLTHGKISQVNAMVRVIMGESPNEVAIFDNQFIVTGVVEKFSAPGDSGSCILTEASAAMVPAPVGLLFAGSDTITIGNDINKVMSHLDVDFKV